MSSTINTRIQLKHDTTANWNRASGFVPKRGEVIIYDDYETKTYVIQEYGQTVEKTKVIPNIKIGTGNAYVQDLPFVDENTREMLLDHIHNQEIHVTLPTMDIHIGLHPIHIHHILNTFRGQQQIPIVRT